MSSKKLSALLHWMTLMIDALPTLVTTATPVALLIVNEVLRRAGTAHAPVGWQVQALAYTLLVGNVLRRGLESGMFVKQLRKAAAEWDTNPLIQSQPWPPPDQEVEHMAGQLLADYVARTQVKTHGR